MNPWLKIGTLRRIHKDILFAWRLLEKRLDDTKCTVNANTYRHLDIKLYEQQETQLSWYRADYE